MEQQYASGIIAVIKHLEAILIRKHRMLRKNPHTFAQKVSPLTPVISVEAANFRNTDPRQISQEDGA
jgi:hypothetical protein